MTLNVVENPHKILTKILDVRCDKKFSSIIENCRYMLSKIDTRCKRKLREISSKWTENLTKNFQNILKLPHFYVGLGSEQNLEERMRMNGHMETRQEADNRMQEAKEQADEAEEQVEIWKKFPPHILDEVNRF
jgi:hypothetical protein